MTPIDSKAYKAAAKAMEITFGKTPIPVRGGGSIPMCALFEKELGIKVAGIFCVASFGNCIYVLLTAKTIAHRLKKY